MQYGKTPDSPFIVSVWMVTYNHEDFISIAVESVMNQQASFPIKLIIAEDFSTDSTREICLKLKNKYGDRIELFLNKQNIGAEATAHKLYDVCTKSGAKYIAMLEGDDYWTDPLKLQKQVNVLENDLSLNACFHNVKIIDSADGAVHYVYDQGRKDIITLMDLGDGDYMKTCSLLFRNIPGILLPILDGSIPVKDTSLGYCLLYNGKNARYLNQTMAVYRKHDGGIMSKVSHEKKLLYSLKCLQQYRSFYHDNVLKPRLNKLYLFQSRQLLRISVRHLKPLQFIRTFWNMLMR